MLNGTLVNLTVFAPTLGNSISVPQAATVDDQIEFFDVKDLDILGDSYFVASAQFDISDNVVHYEVTEKAFTLFQNVGNGFNGYVLTFDGSANSDVSIRSAKIIADQTTLDLDPTDITFDAATLRINVSGIGFVASDTFAIELGLELIGGPVGSDLNGGDGKDHIRCGAGGDQVFAGAGNDKIWGGAQSDRFVFAKNDGRDTIFNFDAASAEHDALDLSGLREISGYRDLTKHHLFQRGDDLIIELRGTNRICLKDVSTGDLDPSDFIL